MKSPHDVFPIGHLADQIAALRETQSFAVFAAFVRGGDVRRWLKRELKLTDESFADALVDLDNRQAEFLPERIDDIAPRTRGTLRGIFEFVKVQLRKKSPDALLSAICGRGAPAASKYLQPSSCNAPRPPRTAPATWRLSLPVPPAFRPLAKISPTRVDSYLRCPFTFYLRDKEVLGDKRMDDRVRELARWECGNLAHEALEAFGADAALRDSTDADAIRAFLERKVDEQLADRFGAAVPPPVADQGERVRARLANFARLQAKRRADGWRLVAAERKLEIELPDEGHDGTAHAVRLYGKCDRIDFNDSTGEWLVLDYKTWDTAERAKCFETNADGSRTWRSVQLPAYCAMLAADASAEFAAATLDRISASYCVIGRTADDVLVTEPLAGSFVPEAIALVRTLVSRIERGLFWPPATTGEWRHDYADWLGPKPEESVSADWIADQMRRGQTR